jgi:hypothetical protein
LPANFTLAQFDDIYEIVHDTVDLQAIPELNDSTYQPRNTTALLDAIGKTLVRADQSNRKQIVFAILTDGFENASKEYNRSQIFDMIKARRDKGWQILFLAANQDAIQAGAVIGIQAAQCMSFAHTGQGVNQAYKSTSRLASSYRMSGKLQSFTDDDRNLAK